MSAPDVRRLLEDLGSIEPPPPDPDFIDRLEFQLRAETIALAPDLTYDDAPWRVPFGIAAAAFTVVAGVAGITVIRDMPDREVSAQLAAASNARVILPNGEEYAAEPGMVIPKGAVVEVFDDGVAEINGIHLGAGSRVVVTGSGGVEPIDADEVPVADSDQMAAPGGRSGDDSGGTLRIDPSFPRSDSEPATGDGLTPGLVPSGDDIGPLRQAERTAKSRGVDAVRRTTTDAAPPQTSVAAPAPSVDDDGASTDQAAPPSTTVPETTAAPAPEAGPAPPEAAPPATDTPTSEAPTTAPPLTTAPPAPAPDPAPTTPPSTTPPTTVPQPTVPTTTPDLGVPAVPPSGTTTTTTPDDVDPATGEDGGEVTPPADGGKGDTTPGGGGDPTGYDDGAANQPKTSGDPGAGDDQVAAGTEAGADDSGSDETASADTGADDSGSDETASADDSAGDTTDGGTSTDEAAAADPLAVE